MSDPRDNGYGVHPKYEIGDEVMVWPVFKRPIGTIEKVMNPEDAQMKYQVSYQYEDGRIFTEEFEASDLTLHRKYASKWNPVCECGSNSGRHDGWCPKFKRE